MFVSDKYFNTPVFLVTVYFYIILTHFSTYLLSKTLPYSKFFFKFHLATIISFFFPIFLILSKSFFFFFFVSDPLFYLVCFSQSIFIFTIPLYFLSGYPLLLFFVVITAMIISDFFFHPYNRFIFVLFFHVWFLICCLSYSPLNRLRFFAAWHFFELSFSV